MTLLIRKLDTKKWSPTEVNWLENEQIEADPIGDLATSNNSFSVFLVDDEDDAERVIAAIIAPWAQPKNVGYYAISHEDIEALGFKFSPVAGETSDKVVNKWHRNIIELSGEDLILFAKTLRAKGRLVQMLDVEWVEAIKKSCDSNYLKKSKVKIANQDIREQLGLDPLKK